MATNGDEFPAMADEEATYYLRPTGFDFEETDGWLMGLSGTIGDALIVPGFAGFFRV